VDIHIEVMNPLPQGRMGGIFHYGHVHKYVDNQALELTAMFGHTPEHYLQIVVQTVILYT